MRLCVLAVLVVSLAAASAQAADLDRAAVDFKTPDDIKWIRNPIIQVWGIGPATATPAEKK